MKLLITIILIAILLLALGPFITKWLWNWIMPDLFSLPEINYWKALGLQLLSFVLFRNVPTGGSK